MYPFKDGLTYPRNQWYVGAWSHEVNRVLLERTLLGELVVFYRTESGQPVAVAGRCAHRRFPLVRGKLVGDSIECAYHGWTFDCSGSCVRIPSQETVPSAVRGVRSFPVVEKWQWIWIWMGDPALADPALIPDHSLMGTEDPEWHPVPVGTVRLNARYQLLNENILDLTHLTYVHAATIGTDAIVASSLTFEDHPRHIRSVRTVLNDRATPFHARALGITGRVDRELISDFFPPSLHASGSRFWSAESGSDGQRRLYGEFRVLHVGTPETPQSTHYFWGFTRTFAKGDDDITAWMTENFEKAIAEDIDAIEAQERVVDLEPRMTDASGLADAAAIRGRRRLEALMEAEQHQAEPPYAAVSR